MPRIGTTVVLTFLIVVVAGCRTSTESAEADDLTAHVGQYSAPPTNLQLKRAGVPPFLDASPKEKAKESVENLGAPAVGVREAALNRLTPRGGGRVFLLSADYGRAVIEGSG